MQRCIDRYQPVLESEFQVTLGKVEAKPLRVAEFIDYCFDKAATRMERKGKPSCLQQRLFALEKRIVRIPAYALLSVRFWLPQLMMKWLDHPPAVAVSLSGWSEADYERNTKRLDQWTVHELAHGVWARIAQDGYDGYGRRWRIWNEGFAHYIADVHLRATYPANAVADDDWSAERREGRQRVSTLVNHYGVAVLREIPLRWTEFDDPS